MKELGKGKVRLSSESLLPFSSQSIILPVVLYGCESWSLTLREEHIMRVFENRVLRRIYGPRRKWQGKTA
jgi:hypothetical protein